MSSSCVPANLSMVKKEKVVAKVSRKSLTLKDKMDILSDLNESMTKSAVALKFKVAICTVSRIWSEREKIQQRFGTKNLLMKKCRHVQFDKIDEALIRWFRVQQSRQMPLGGPMLTEKAREFADSFNIQNFKCSNGWLEKWKKRHGISLRREALNDRVNAKILAFSAQIRNTDTNGPPAVATAAVLMPSAELPSDTVVVGGYDFNEGLDYNNLFQSYLSSGFQATQLGLAINEVNKMICLRAEELTETSIGSYEEDEFIRVKTNCTIFLGFTSNMISSGLRDIIRFLVQHSLVDCIVTTAGGVEEDLIKCLEPTYVGDFHLKGSELREKGINRIGNLLVPNKNYCKFEDWIMPLLDKLLVEQKEKQIIWSPSKIIQRLGLEINDPNSVCYWAQKNKIPIFCPALIDGSLGDMIYFHSYRNPGLIVDIAQDIRRLNNVAVGAVNSGMIVLGGSIVKHHICNANMMRNGADFAVFINTGNDFDGSDSGAQPDEAVSWGKIKKDANPVKIDRSAAVAKLVEALVVDVNTQPTQSFKSTKTKFVVAGNNRGQES